MKYSFLVFVGFFLASCSERQPIEITKISMTDDSLYVAFNQSMEDTEVKLTYIKPDGSRYINMFMEAHSFFKGDTASSFTEVKNNRKDEYLDEEEIKECKFLRDTSFKEIRYLILGGYRKLDTLGYGVYYPKK